MTPNRAFPSASLKRAMVGYLLGVTVALVASCATVTPVPPSIAETAPTATAALSTEGLTDEQAATLASLSKLDDYPLYTMRYYGALPVSQSSGATVPAEISAKAGWACSLFAALGDPDDRLCGRNFDWRFSPALLLFTEPPGGYASVSMVDLEYFGFSDRATGRLLDPMQLPLTERRRLLETPQMPFDGMNAAGLAIGMAAVPQADERHDPGKPAIDSIAVIREILDHASNVEEAVGILKRYNIDWQGGPPLHYLVADRSGQSALVEFWNGQTQVIHGANSWHAATNFTRSAVEGSAAGQCPRYDALVGALTAANGRLGARAALSLLQTVSQIGTQTQWSVVYNMSQGQVDVVMGRRYDRAHTLHLDVATP